MPTLEFKGKQHIYAHHLTVPYRPLVSDVDRSLNPGGTDDNLIIHGDNLHALKALLPRYVGRVKCIYIDPPYNTGNEGWVYNDRVNSPLMREWLRENGPVDNEDLERHDKWLCMMWPRLHLLRELLADDGVIFVSIDDNEQHHLRMLMDEVFGEGNFVSNYVWKSRSGKDHTAKHVSKNHDHILCYASNIGTLDFSKDIRVTTGGKYRDDHGTYSREQVRQWGTNDRRLDRPTMYFPVLAPDGSEIYPIKDNGEEGCWRVNQSRMLRLLEANEIDFVYDAETNKWKVYAKKYAGKETRTAHNSILETFGTSANGTREISGLFGNKVFDTTKPVDLIKHLIYLSVSQDGIVLDSFAGSGTTAHAVLALNKEDGGDRKFILVECEDYADSITAERMRRVINGVPSARDKSLQEGLGGSFTYFTLGEPIEMEGMLTGEALPEYSALAAYLLHVVSGVSDSESDLKRQNCDGLFYSSSTTSYYLIYEPDTDYLSSNEGMLNEERAKRINAEGQRDGKKAIVFGPGKYIGQRELTGMGITFCQLPYEMHVAR